MKALHYPLISPGPLPQGKREHSRSGSPCPDGITCSWTAGRAPNRRPRINHQAYLSAAKLENCAPGGISQRVGCGACFGGQVPVVLRWGDRHRGRCDWWGRGQQAVTVTCHSGSFEANQLEKVPQFGYWEVSVVRGDSSPAQSVQPCPCSGSCH